MRSTILNILTATLGNALVYLKPQRAQQLSDEGMTIVLGKMSFGDKLMRRAILKKLEKQQDFTKLEQLHQNYWANKGAEFFLSNEKSFTQEFLTNCAFIFDELEKELSKTSTQYHTLVEIGTGSGSVLNYLSARFPQINKYIGIDLSPEQIELNNKKFSKNPRLDFVASDGFEWVKAHGQGNTIF